MLKTKRIRLSIVVPVALLAMVLVLNTQNAWMKEVYVPSWYPPIGVALRTLWGWCPFSLGDIFYLGCILWFILGLYRLWQGRSSVGHWQKSGYKTLLFLAYGISAFYLLWGFNYARKPVQNEFDFQTGTYSLTELDSLEQWLGTELNQLAVSGRMNRDKLATKDVLFREAVTTYSNAGRQYGHLTYRGVSLKPSLFSYVGNIVGFQGYYNPFTGEAQVNTTIPLFLQPFVACHEMAHQLGYAKENEANFIGFLTAHQSHDPRFRYSAFLDMWMYTIKDLGYRDSTLAKERYRRIDTLVKQDIAEYRAFSRKYANPVEWVTRKLYGEFLRLNRQPSGMKAYSDVVGMLIGWRKKQPIVTVWRKQ